MKICFTGDVFLGGDLLDRPCGNIIKSQVFNDADVRVVNLEQPISDGEYIEDKCTLYTGSCALKQLSALKVNVVNLSHNHIQDKGPDAINETVGHLDSIGIKHFGAGADIERAGSPCWLTEDIAILGYCEFDKPYLRQIVVATDDKPGINPLRYEKIKLDLDRLPVGKKAILYFHWGMEHVWLPPAGDIALAKKLLEDDRVLTIIGMHPHRVQGIVRHAGKIAYMCLGNFIFPNFYIAPPVQILYPSEEEKANTRFQTRQYHGVHEVTYKKWRWVNRVSVILEYCTERQKIRPVFVVQDDDAPEVTDLKGTGLFFYRCWFSCLTAVYKLPVPVYRLLWRIHAFEVRVTWRLQIMLFHLKQLGFKGFSKKLRDDVRKKFQNSIALVLGGHVNGYSIVKELYEQNIKNIAVFDMGRSLARLSNKVICRKIIDKTPETLLLKIKELHETHDYIVVFPTDDLQLTNLLSIYEQISDFCYIPLNRKTLEESSDKYFQYMVCEKTGVPYPKSVNVKRIEDLDIIEQLSFPLLVKPSIRQDLTINVFRSIYLETEPEYFDARSNILKYIENGVDFVVSEYIPGDDTNIYAYTCCRSSEGEILNEWSGKKLTQYPDNYGVFSSASNEVSQEVVKQGRALVHALDAFGIVEPEFKYDHRDGRYKLMEVNLRSMMWNRVGAISGVKLHETQFNYATGRPVRHYEQDKSKSVHFVLMLHEVSNLIARKGYWKHFKHNVFGGKQRGWAIFEWQDIKPFFYSLLLLLKFGVAACQRRFGLS